jgi:hypothetical protein
MPAQPPVTPFSDDDTNVEVIYVRLLSSCGTPNERAQYIRTFLQARHALKHCC